MDTILVYLYWGSSSLCSVSMFGYQSLDDKIVENSKGVFGMISLTSMLILLGVLLLCLVLGVPIGFALGLSGLVTILLTVGDQFMIQVPMTLYKSLSEFVFVAIPLYILMGEILYQGKSGERIFWVANSWLHRV